MCNGTPFTVEKILPQAGLKPGTARLVVGLDNYVLCLMDWLWHSNKDFYFDILSQNLFIK